MKFRIGRIPGRYAVIAFSVGLLAGASLASAAPLVVVSGRVCDLGARSSVRGPEPGEVQCSATDIPAGGVKISAINRRGKKVFATRTRPVSGVYRLRLRAGNYSLGIENGGYSLDLKVGTSGIKNVDLIRGIIF